MKTSKVFRIAQYCVLQMLPIDTDEQKDTALEVLSVLMKEEEMAKMLEAIAEKEENNNA